MLSEQQGLDLINGKCKRVTSLVDYFNIKKGDCVAILEEVVEVVNGDTYRFFKCVRVEDHPGSRYSLTDDQIHYFLSFEFK